MKDQSFSSGEAMNVREESGKWKDLKFRDMILESTELGFSNDQANATIDMLGHANRNGNDVLEKRVTGHLVEGLIKYPTSENHRASFWFANVFHDLEKAGKLSPATFCMEVGRLLPNEGPSSDPAFCGGFLARGLRTFASLLREPDFESSLLLALRQSDPSAISHADVDQDVYSHTDLFVTFNGKNYRVWHYQSSYRGINKLVKKLRGLHRGVLEKGLHILCPVDVFGDHTQGDVEDVHGWRLSSMNYCERIRDLMANESPKSYDRIRQNLRNPNLFKAPIIFEK